MFVPSALIQDVEEAKPGSEFRINRKIKGLWAYTELPSAPSCPSLGEVALSRPLQFFL